jgi:KaiC/GvpD/RAD55 family RecA-like ATPase
MQIALVPSGVGWLDAEIGGFPAPGIVAALGRPGTGKTNLALGFARAQLERSGRVCYLTSETPEAVIETCRGALDFDVRPHIARGMLTLLSFAPFFVNKTRSLSSVDAPLGELGTLLEERGIAHVVVDTLDPMLAWIEATNAKVEVRRVLGQMQAWGRAVVCTVTGESAAALELARSASGSLELGDKRLVVRQAGWCNIYDLEGSTELVQGRGLVARSMRAPKAAPGGAGEWTSLIGSSGIPARASDRRVASDPEPTPPTAVRMVGADIQNETVAETQLSAFNDTIVTPSTPTLAAEPHAPDTERTPRGHGSR